MTTRRIFAAIDISAEAREHVVQYIKTLRREADDRNAKWEREEKLHITLKFAGDLDEIGLAGLARKVETAAGEISPFTITINGTGAFAKRRSYSAILWLALEASPTVAGQDPFIEIVSFLETDAGPRQKFKPHLTLARLKEPKRFQHLIAAHLAADLAPVSFTASELVIYESELKPAGSVYKVISKHPFRRPGA
jgi:RNA 2',3'-cyclic 3'-phosphodiesterase